MSYQISGIVASGKKRGAGLGFPTINIPVQAPPPDGWGIYFSQVEIEGSVYHGITHVGPVPTFGDTAPTCETFLLDASRDFYGKKANKLLLKKHRDVVNFVSAEALKEEIANDIIETKKYFSL